jgi:hypothetical protein
VLGVWPLKKAVEDFSILNGSAADFHSLRQLPKWNDHPGVVVRCRL